MMKRLFLLFMLSTIGVINASTVLVANGVEIINEPEFLAVETIIEPEPQEVLVEELPLTPNAGALSAVVQPVDNITIGGRVVPLIRSGGTEYVSDYAANIYGDKFIYGHNTDSILRTLYLSYPGQSFSVTINGITKNYVIGDIVIYDKNLDNGLLQIGGKGNYINSVINAIDKKISATGQVDLNYYSMALMTCYGTMLGGGDATQRLVVFAYEV